MRGHVMHSAFEINAPIDTTKFCSSIKEPTYVLSLNIESPCRNFSLTDPLNHQKLKVWFLPYVLRFMIL